MGLCPPTRCRRTSAPRLVSRRHPHHPPTKPPNSRLSGRRGRVQLAGCRGRVRLPGCATLQKHYPVMTTTRPHATGSRLAPVTMGRALCEGWPDIGIRYSGLGGKIKKVSGKTQPRFRCSRTGLPPYCWQPPAVGQPPVRGSKYITYRAYLTKPLETRMDSRCYYFCLRTQMRSGKHLNAYRTEFKCVANHAV